MAWLVWQTVETDLAGARKQIVSGRLPSSAAATAARAALVTAGTVTTAASGTIEVLDTRLRGLGIGAWLRESSVRAERELVAAPTDLLAASARWQAAQIMRLGVAWRGWLRIRQAWWADIAAAGPGQLPSYALAGTTRWVDHQLGAARRCAEGAGPFAPNTQSEREALIDWAVHWTSHPKEPGDPTGPEFWYDVLAGVSNVNRTWWALTAGTAATAVVNTDLFQARTGGGMERRTPDTSYAPIGTLTLGDPVWRAGT